MSRAGTSPKRAKNPALRTLYIFNTISLIAGSVYGLYYGVFLYKNTFSLQVLAIDGLLGGLGIWLGYLLGVTIVKRWGYGSAIKWAFALWAGIAFATAAMTTHIATWFMVFAILRAIPGGIYGAVGDTIMLRDVKSTSRSGFFKMNLAIEFAASIVLPAAVGALISYSQGYEWAFVVAGALYLAGLFHRCKLPRPQLSLDTRGMLELFRRPLYPAHAVNRTLSSGFNQLNAFALTIVPFLLLEDELSVGLLTSASAVVAIVVALGSRKLKTQRLMKIGYSAYGLRSVAAFLFVTVWTAPMMAMWQLVGKVLTPLHDPLQQSLDIHNDGLILGKDAKKQALQINIVNTTLKFAGSTIAFGGFVLITQVDASQQKAILASLIMAYAAWRFVNLAASAWINTWAKDIPAYLAMKARRTEQLVRATHLFLRPIYRLHYQVADLLRNTS